MNRQGQITMRRQSAERWSQKILNDETTSKVLRALSRDAVQQLHEIFTKHLDELLADRARYYEAKQRKAAAQ